MSFDGVDPDFVFVSLTRSQWTYIDDGNFLWGGRGHRSDDTSVTMRVGS